VPETATRSAPHRAGGRSVDGVAGGGVFTRWRGARTTHIRRKKAQSRIADAPALQVPHASSTSANARSTPSPSMTKSGSATTEGKNRRSRLQCLAARGYMDEYPISRLYRDSRVAAHYAGETRGTMKLVTHAACSVTRWSERHRGSCGHAESLMTDALSHDSTVRTREGEARPTVALHEVNRARSREPGDGDVRARKKLDTVARRRGGNRLASIGR